MKKRLMSLISLIVLMTFVNCFKQPVKVKAEIPEEIAVKLNSYEKISSRYMNAVDLGVGYINSETADDVTKKQYENSTNSNNWQDYFLGDGNCNAYRHAYWNILNYLMGNEIAIEMGNAHEEVPSNNEVAYDNRGNLIKLSEDIMVFDTKEQAAHYMDLYNNMMGRKIASAMFRAMINEREKYGDKYIKPSTNERDCFDLSKLKDIDLSQNKFDMNANECTFSCKIQYRVTMEGKDIYLQRCDNWLRLFINIGELRRLEKTSDNKYKVVPTNGDKMINKTFEII